MEARSRRPADGPTRVEASDLVVVLGAVTLLVSLFLDWFDPGLSAWSVFEALDLVLAALAIAALLIVAGGFALPRAVPPRWLAPIAAVAFVIVAGALLNHPPAALAESPSSGAWLALAGATLLAIGAALRAARISLAIRFESSRGSRSPEREKAAGSYAPPPPPAQPRGDETGETRTMRDGG